MDFSTAIKIKFNDFELPISVDNDCDYYCSLQDKLLEYSRYVEKILGSTDNIINGVDENIGLIAEALALYQDAQINGAKDCILKILRKYEHNDFVFSTIDKSYSTRGLAPFFSLQQTNQNDVFYQMNTYHLSFFKARSGGDIFCREQMLHIPLNQRNLISTQRFSIPGVPCLYLGTTSYVCWLEMNKPAENEFNISSYYIPGDLKVINLTIQQMLINGTATGYIEASRKQDYELTHICENLLKLEIELWPLVCATSYTTRNTTKYFRSDYIISQLIMMCLNDLNIDGVTYLSKKMSDYDSYPQGVNIAIPIKSNGLTKYNDTKELYGELCERIELTEPINFSQYLRLKHPYSTSRRDSYINYNYPAGDPMSYINYGGRRISYQDIVFSDFDNYLFALDHDLAELYK